MKLIQDKLVKAFREFSEDDYDHLTQPEVFSNAYFKWSNIPQPTACSGWPDPVHCTNEKQTEKTENISIKDLFTSGHVIWIII